MGLYRLGISKRRQGINGKLAVRFGEAKSFLLLAFTARYLAAVLRRMTLLRIRDFTVLLRVNIGLIGWFFAF
jgi:hypothetical protein